MLDAQPFATLMAPHTSPVAEAVAPTDWLQEFVGSNVDCWHLAEVLQQLLSMQLCARGICILVPGRGWVRNSWAGASVLENGQEPGRWPVAGRWPVCLDSLPAATLTREWCSGQGQAKWRGGALPHPPCLVFWAGAEDAWAGA